MSDQGFHEVQLSGKQLVFLFMSAVAVMVVVFLLGVNVGRGVRSAVGEPEVLAQGDPSTPKESDSPGGNPANGEPAKAAQPELSYHDMLLGATAPADKGTAADKGATPPGDKDKTPPSEAPPPIAEAPPPVQTSAPTPAATPPAARPTATQTAPAQAEANAPKSNASAWFLQTGAYSTQAVAEGQVAQLKKLNVPAFVVQPEAGSKLFRVRVGPYSDRAEAEQIKSRIARQGFTSSITR